VLAVLAVVAALVGVVTLYADRVLFDADEFADHVAVALEEDAVADELARVITDDVVLQAKRDLVAVQPVIEGVAGEIIGSSPFRGIVRAAVADLHRSVFDRDANTVTLTLVDVGTVVRSALEATNPKLAKRVLPDTAAEIVDAEPPDGRLGVVQAAEELRRAELFLLGAALLLLAGAMALGRDARRTLMTLGAGAALGGAALVVVLGISRSLVLGGVDDPDLEAALGAVWDTFLGDLKTLLLIVAGSGAVIAAATRSLLRPVGIEEPLRRAWTAVTTVPDATWLRTLRAAVLVALGVLVILNRETAVDLAVLLAALYVLYKGVEELLRLLAGPARGEEVAESTGGAALTRRQAVVSFAAVALIAAVLAAFTAGGGADAPASDPDTCNGSAALCDRGLADVALPGTHNAMSAANQPDYLFPQQDAPIADQLDDGVRALFIDAHYGTRVEGGVRTDLSSVEGERETYAAELGEEGLDAALRIRDQLGFAGDGERAVYLCHRFCELGAVEAEKALRDVRDFLLISPDAVLVIVVEDYVSPEDWVDVVEASGLDELVYDGPLSPEAIPTLGELVDSGERVVMMAENEAGGAAWYRSAYEELVQETPYSFRKRPQLLLDDDKLAASCKPNRGPEGAPFFLVNHWIDTSPAAKPSNAERVNEGRALLRRIRQCEAIRGRRANLVSVDFYATGDLFDVIERLNGSAGIEP
jgi:hypothetical protein